MLIVKKIDSQPYHEIALLFQDSFAERVRDGMNFSCSTYSEKEVRSACANTTAVICAYEDSELLGIVMLSAVCTKFGFRFATHANLAVATKAQGKGVASKMFAELRKAAVDANLDFVFSDTAEKAKSSVAYHVKNGFFICGKVHFPGRNYDSLLFIHPISRKGKLLSSWLGRKIISLIFANR